MIDGLYRPQGLPAGVGKRASERLYPSSSKYKTNPTLWVNEVVNEYVWEMQIRILDAIRDHKQVAIRSCHASGKSHIMSRGIGWWLDPRVHALGSAFAVTTAPSWPQVNAILWRYLKKLHGKAKLPGRITMEAQWHMSEPGSKYRVNDPSEELIAMGRKPADYDENALQGIHAMYVLGVIDEANGVPKQLFDAMLAITTNDFSRVVAIGNPDDPATHFAEICKPDSGWHVIDIPAFITPGISQDFCEEFDLPYIKAEYEIPKEDTPEELLQVLVTENWIRARAKDWGVGSPLWESRVMGRFPQVSDDTLISPAMLSKGYACQHSGVETGQYALDVARLGADKTVMYRNRGFQIRFHKSWAKKDTEETADLAAAELDRHPAIKRVPINIDAIGVGAGVFDKLKRRGYNVRAIYGSEKARNPRRYANRRAEMYWTFRNLLDEGAIDLDEQDTVLAAQLGSIKWWEDNAGRIVIESKEDMRKRGLPSPNEADTAVMSILKHGSSKEVDHETTRKKKHSLAGDLLDKVM